MRRGEISGLRWESYNGDEVRVTGSVWNGVETEPKTLKSKAAVPVVAPLRLLLDAHRAAFGNPASGPVFENAKGRPLCLNNLTNRAIIPVLRSAGIHWHGWHAFRRGLASNLYRLGVPDKIIQAILRHSNLTTTMNVYVKTVDQDSFKAMKALETLLTTAAEVDGIGDELARVN